MTVESEMNLRDEIAERLNNAEIQGFRFVRISKYKGILERLASNFLKNGTSDLRHCWLWSEFVEPVLTSQCDDQIACLRLNLNCDEKFWFLASDEHGKYWVAESTGDSIVRVIEEMYHFEYYISDLHMNWLFCENHHGVFIETGKNGPIDRGLSGASE